MDFIGLNLKQINTKLGHRRAEHSFYIDSTQYGLCTEKTYKELIEVFSIDKIDGFKEFAELKAIDNQFKKQYASTFNLWEGKKYKSNILKYKKDYDGYHPTQKPILLLEDLIKTFSNENDLVVDLTMGSGSTGVACRNTKRNFIGIEKDEQYFKIAEQRINARTLFS
jgi:site-specific DNA-methyltransferase (adenine-specific)